MNLGEKIRVAREAAGLTQEELGKRCNTTKQTIYKYETGKVTNIPIDRLEKIASVLGVSSSYLIGWDSKKNTPSEPELTEGEKKLIDLFRKAPADRQELVLKMIETAIENI